MKIITAIKNVIDVISLMCKVKVTDDSVIISTDKNLILGSNKNLLIYSNDNLVMASGDKIHLNPPNKDKIIAAIRLGLHIKQNRCMDNFIPNQSHTPLEKKVE